MKSNLKKNQKLQNESFLCIFTAIKTRIIFLWNINENFSKFHSSTLPIDVFMINSYIDAENRKKTFNKKLPFSISKDLSWGLELEPELKKGKIFCLLCVAWKEKDVGDACIKRA